jgi:small-conductance mechanosensitive channel
VQDDTEFAILLKNTWRDVQSPDVLWQLATLAVCFGLAWLLERYVLARVNGRGEPASALQRFGRSWLRRMLFPLSALVLVATARPILGTFHHVTLLNLAVPLLTSLAVIRFVVFSLREVVGRSSWIAGFERVFSLLVWIVVALYILGWLPEVLASLEAVSFTVGSQRLSILTLFEAIAVVMLTLLVALWVAGLLERRLMATAGLDANVRLVMLRIVKTVLIVVAVLVALPMVGIDLTTLSVFGGALGVGLGFGLQKIAANYVSGFIILLDRSLRIGNMISVGAERGIVTQINTRYTVIRAGSGVESLVPNETLVGSIVQNETYTDSRVSAALNFQVSYDSDVERAMEILVAVAREHPRVLKEPAPKAFLVAFGASGIDLRVSVWLQDPENGTLGVTSDVNLEVWRRFRAADIEIPFPQSEVRLLAPLPPVALERGPSDAAGAQDAGKKPERRAALLRDDLEDIDF